MCKNDYFITFCLDII